MGPLALLGLTALWLGGLWHYTFVLTASLPGLTHTQAFTLNTVGSAASNLLPFGGGAGVGVTVALTSRWGVPTEAVAASILVTGIWNAVAGIALPAAGLTLLAATDQGPTHWQVLTVATLLWLLASVVVVVAGSTAAGGRIAAGAERAARMLPAVCRPTPGRVAELVNDVRRGGVAAVRANWLTLTAALIGYIAMQGHYSHAASMPSARSSIRCR